MPEEIVYVERSDFIGDIGSYSQGTIPIGVMINKLSNILDLLNVYKERYGQESSVFLECNGRVIVYYKEPETAEEKVKRLELEERREKVRKQLLEVKRNKEYEQYLRLKEKFESK